jgi:hypothetical protein
MTPGVVIEIGGVAVRVRTADAGYTRLLERRYSGFLSASERFDFDFEVALTDARIGDPDDDVQVTRLGKSWTFRRGDFLASWNTSSRSGSIRQSVNPYSLDAALRILHTLLLANEGGFLLHAASAVRNGRAFLFSGRSGAGKTTLSSLAPPDVALLSDEISYVKRTAGGYVAFGTPFAGELGKSGNNVSAPVAACYLLAQGAENRIDPVEPTEALQALLGNVLFFAEDPELVRSVFESACRFVDEVPLRRLTFRPDRHVWRLVV